MDNIPGARELYRGSKSINAFFNSARSSPVTFTPVFACEQNPRAAASTGSSPAMQSQNDATVLIFAHFKGSVSIPHLHLRKPSSILIISPRGREADPDSCRGRLLRRRFATTSVNVTCCCAGCRVVKWSRQRLLEGSHQAALIDRNYILPNRSMHQERSINDCKTVLMPCGKMGILSGSSRHGEYTYQTDEHDKGRY